MNEKFEKVIGILKKYEQEHLLTFYEELNADERNQLLDQILKIDFGLMKSLYNNIENTDNKFQNIIVSGRIKPVDAVIKENIDEMDKNLYTKKGEEIIRSGKYAVMTMAGGQGTRLGHDGPKGTFIFEGKSLFEIFIDKLKRAKQLYNVSITWYIMTSRENDKATKIFFESNNYFGYGKENIVFFSQAELPIINTYGKMMMESKFKVKEAANGNGGIFNSIKTHNILYDIKNKEIEWVYIVGIDNPIVDFVDPVFIGFNAVNESLIGTKTIMKSSPNDRMGVFCEFDEKPYVIEYTEMPQKLAEMRDKNGNLLYGDAHIMMNLFSTKSLEKLVNEDLPYHKAFKKIPYISADGSLVEPQEPNAYKFEAFVFDSFKIADKIIPFRVKREDEFAPIKNKTGDDSPETARKLYIKKVV